jgi:hypothetical protein
MHMPTAHRASPRGLAHTDPQVEVNDETDVRAIDVVSGRTPLGSHRGKEGCP